MSRSYKNSSSTEYAEKPVLPSPEAIDGERAEAESESKSEEINKPPRPSWRNWYAALKQALPIYIATHLAFLGLTYLSALFRLANFTTKTFPVTTMLDAWFRWDSGHYTYIAMNGYTEATRTAFFPLFPLLERGAAYLTGDPFVAGLLVSNLAGLAMLTVLQRLVREDFGLEQATRTVLYLAVFPTAFFFAAAYNESLFLLLTLLSFYYMRRGNWWLAGLYGLLTCLTRSAGLCLLLPFLYEYLRQRNFSLKAIRFDIVSGLAIPAGVGIFAAYCYVLFHDPLAFSHAETAGWSRHLQAPWQGLINAVIIMQHRHVLSFDSIHNMLDLSMCLFIGGLAVLGFVGPWKFRRDQWTYTMYMVLIYLFGLMFPIDGSLPLGAFSRYMLEVFPAFIVLAALGRRQSVNLYYLTLTLPVLTFMLLQFLTGYWII